VIKDRTTENSIAHQKPATPNPGTMYEESMMSRAFMTKVNKPRVKTFIGSVSRTIIGFMKALIAPSTTARISATKKPSIFTPGKTYAVIMMATAHMIQLMKIFMVYDFLS
jgi:hypothetical protein